MSSFKLDSNKKINNNGAVVVNGGNVGADSQVSTNLSLEDLGSKENYASTVKRLDPTDDGVSSPYGVIPAVSGVDNVFAYDQAKYGDRSVIARGVGEAGNKINRVTNTVLNSPGSEYAGVPRFKSNVVSGDKRVGGDSWVFPLPASGGGQLNPGFTPDPSGGVRYNFEDGMGNDAADKNTNATRAVPGEITFRTGSPIPQTVNFKARDTSEGTGS